MNRIKKIRGHKKIQKRIQNWIEENRTINISDFLANKYCYTNVSFDPYFNISINNANQGLIFREIKREISLI